MHQLGFRLRQFVEDNPGLVTRKESNRYPGLYVLKYKNKVFYDNLWTPELQEMRGLVVDKDWNVVVYPFTKIFNYGENGATIPLDENVIAVLKINGFLGCLTRRENGNIIVSTTGSLDSPYVDMAKEMLDQTGFDPMCGCTYMFEICHPNDPHIIKEKPGVYLIGMRDLLNYSMMSEATLDTISHLNGKIFRPSWFEGFEFGQVLKLYKQWDGEGLVVHGKTTCLKLKTPKYLVTKFLARKRMDKLVDMLHDPQQLKQTIDEEFYPLIDYLAERVMGFSAADEQGRIAMVREFLEK